MISNKKFRIIITSGEPSGIGPDLIIMLAQKKWPIELIICADPKILIERSIKLKLPLQIHSYNINKQYFSNKSGDITVLPPLVLPKTKCIAGKLNVLNSEYVLSTLSRACDGCINGEFAALVTGPVHKGIIQKSGFPFIGHTEFFSKRSGCKQAVMMFVNKKFRVALVTTHIPLKEVSKKITKKLLYEVIIILIQELKKNFFILNPKIYVCGLNPHSGENGYIGNEEIEIIIPILNLLRSEGYNLIGPIPSDTIFQSKYIQDADTILTMYHDQGLPIIKYFGFDQTVNITLGLPFIRTSVSHGTALELAGSGLAKSNSIETAINLAINIIENSI